MHTYSIIQQKAARKLDTSFKDVLYAQNTRAELKELDMDCRAAGHGPTLAKSAPVVKIINNKVTSGSGSGESKGGSQQPPSYLNHGDVSGTPPSRRGSGNKETSSLGGSLPNHKRNFIDDYNNNQLKIIKVSTCFFLYWKTEKTTDGY